MPLSQTPEGVVADAPPPSGVGVSPRVPSEVPWIPGLGGVLVQGRLQQQFFLQPLDMRSDSMLYLACFRQ